MACGLGVATPAHADLELQIGVAAGASFIRTMPALTSRTVTTTAARDVPGGDVALRGSLAALGGGLDVAFSTDDRWIFPMIGFAGYGAVGNYDTVRSSLDGSIATVRPWTTFEGDVLLPGVGYRVKRRRFSFSAGLRTGLVWLAAKGSVAGGAASSSLSLVAISALLQAEIAACRRLDPVTRVCLQLAPRIYDFGFLNGATLGLRVEWGR